MGFLTCLCLVSTVVEAVNVFDRGIYRAEKENGQLTGSLFLEADDGNVIAMCDDTVHLVDPTGIDRLGAASERGLPRQADSKE